MDWKLDDANQRFSDVMDRALTEGPQRVRRGDDEVVVMSADEYERLAGRTAPAK